MATFWMLLAWCSGVGGLRGHAALPACPLVLSTPSMEQLFGSYP
jgi:hypothetical protein